MPDILTPNQTADFLLVESRERGEVLTNLKLQKLLYYSQAWNLAERGEPLFEEDFQAWVHGPVLPTQYRRFRDFQWKPLLVEVEAPRVVGVIKRHLEEIIDVFGTETAVSLELMTHRERPWIAARGNLAPDANSNAIIPKQAMTDYYRELMNS